VTGFPGGTGVSRLRVYDWPAADGLAGGSPHMHTASTEGYLVLAGTGTAETLCGSGYTETPLAPGGLLWFTPGTVHRLVNTSGDLQVLAIMQNGLPEAGDAVLTFPPAILADPVAYVRAATLPPAPLNGRAGATRPGGGNPWAEAARQRRDLAVEGYLLLREHVITDGPSALRSLHMAAARLVRSQAAGWLEQWREGPLAQAIQTGEQLHELAAGRGDHLAQSAVYRADAPPGPAGWGMCGRLETWDIDRGYPAAESAVEWSPTDL
jgi:mannose-6-phosphate isomerase-like protein (cupin superfamily)